MNPTDPVFIIMCVVWFVLGLILYLLPWLIAKGRDMQGTGALLFVNLFFGWSGIGWVACLLWAALGQTKAQKRFYESAKA